VETPPRVPDQPSSSECGPNHQIRQLRKISFHSRNPRNVSSSPLASRKAKTQARKDLISAYPIESKMSRRSDPSLKGVSGHLDHISAQWEVELARNVEEVDRKFKQLDRGLKEFEEPRRPPLGSSTGGSKTTRNLEREYWQTVFTEDWGRQFARRSPPVSAHHGGAESFLSPPRLSNRRTPVKVTGRGSAPLRPATPAPTAKPNTYGGDGAGQMMFGQRYKAAGKAKGAVVTTARRLKLSVPPSRLLDCVVCAETKAASEFPSAAITKACLHPPQTCLECVATSIRTDLKSKRWSEIKCTECSELLAYDDVERFADPKTFEAYSSLSLRATISESPNFLWCIHGCGDGQIHEKGPDQPIVTCRSCDQRACFHHKVKWHEDMTCDEYDAFLKDPQNYRGTWERMKDKVVLMTGRRKQEEEDRAFALKLVREGAEWDRTRREERKRMEQEKRERKEKEKRLEEMRREAAKKQEEEQATAATMEKTTRPCPSCKAPIEKNKGW
jgi:hypothetical protein